MRDQMSDITPVKRQKRFHGVKMSEETHRGRLSEVVTMDTGMLE